MKVSIEKGALEGNISALSNDLTVARNRLSVLEDERKTLLIGHDSVTQKIYSTLKDLGKHNTFPKLSFSLFFYLRKDTSLLESQSTANDLTAGIVPINSGAELQKGSTSLQLWSGKSSDASGKRNDSPTDLLQSFVREVEKSNSYFISTIKVQFH